MRCVSVAIGLLGLLLIVSVLIGIKIVPEYERQWVQADVELSAGQVWLITASQWLQYWWIVVGPVGLLLVLVGVLGGKRRPEGD
jgi:type II secretory pathway component PulF